MRNPTAAKVIQSFTNRNFMPEGGHNPQTPPVPTQNSMRPHKTSFIRAHPTQHRQSRTPQ